MVIFLVKYVKDNLYGVFCASLPVLHRRNGNARGLFCGKMEYSRRNTAEGNGANVVLRRKVKAACVAGRKERAILFCDSTANNWPYSMQDICARQVECGGYFCASCRLFVSLLLHNVCAGRAQLDSTKCVYAVVNAGVARLVAACHTAVGCVYDCIYAECGDVALPQVEITLFACYIFYGCNATPLIFF